MFGSAFSGLLNTAGPDQDRSAKALNPQTAEDRVIGQGCVIDAGFIIFVPGQPDCEGFFYHGLFGWLCACDRVQGFRQFPLKGP